MLKMMKFDGKYARCNGIPWYSTQFLDVREIIMSHFHTRAEMSGSQDR